MQITVIEPSHEILHFPTEALKFIEMCGRVCYKSEDRITDSSAGAFCQKLNARGHHSVLEHANASVRFIFSRGVSHELVRHRICAISQESTRYCNYGNKGLTFIRPNKGNLPAKIYVPDEVGDYCGATRLWLTAMFDASFAYLTMLEAGWAPQDARDVLPNALKTELVITANFREWRHIFSLRARAGAHPDMIRSMTPVEAYFKERCPEIFCNVPMD